LWGDIVDELFVDEQITNPANAGNNLWATSDHLGTIRDLVDFNGTAYTVANHRPYGSFENLYQQTFRMGTWVKQLTRWSELLTILN
jgi:hypothetical protein